MYTLGIIVASDKGAAGLREDLGGPLIKSIMSDAGYDVAEIKLISDDKETLIKTIRDFADVKKYSLILTTGGTGFSPRDNTPEATLAVLERETPGISEAMRFFGLQKTPRAMLSRGVSGIRKSSLIINLPGSPKAIEECLEFLLPPLSHGLDMLNQNDSECARK